VDFVTLDQRDWLPSLLVASLAHQYQCVGWDSTVTTTGCSSDFTRFIYNVLLGTMIGGWACMVVTALAVAVAACTRNAIKANKAHKQAQLEEDALKKATVGVTSANMGMGKPLPDGAPPLAMAAVATQPIRPSESTYTLAEADPSSPYVQQQYAPPTPQQYYQQYPSPVSPTQTYSPVSPAMSYASLPAGNQSLQPYQQRPMSTVSVTPSQMPPSGDDIMSKV